MRKIFALLFYIWKYIIIYMITQIVVNIISIQIFEEYINLEEIDNLVVKYSFKMIPLVVIITFMIYFILFKFKGENLIYYCDLYNKPNKKYILPVFFLIFGFSLIVTSFGQLIGKGNTKVVTNPMELLVLLIFIPIFEEILFRGIIFNKLRENINLISAIIIQALTFGFLHGGSFQSIYTVILGIILAIIYAYSDCIWITILTHSVFNVLGLIIMPIILEFSKKIITKHILVYSILGIIILFLSFRDFFRTRRKTKTYNKFFIKLKNQ